MPIPRRRVNTAASPPERLPWTEKIEERGVMDLITVEQVTAKLDQALQYTQRLGTT